MSTRQHLQWHLDTIRRLAQSLPVRVHIQHEEFCDCGQSGDDCGETNVIWVASTRIPTIELEWWWTGGRPVVLMTEGLGNEDDETKCILSGIQDHWLPGNNLLLNKHTMRRWEIYWRRFLGAVLALTDIHDRQARAAEAPFQASLFLG
jgi:hypothetical protein